MTGEFGNINDCLYIASNAVTKSRTETMMCAPHLHVRGSGESKGEQRKTKISFGPSTIAAAVGKNAVSG